MPVNVSIQHKTSTPCRSQHKILAYTCEAQQYIALQYLEELVVAYHRTTLLRSESEALLAVPQTSDVTNGNRCFGEAVAPLGNSLPVNINKCKILDSFNKNVKTNVFISAFLT